MSPKVVDLRTGSTEESGMGKALYEGLTAKTLHGDGKWRYSKSITPMVLYDNVGLEMYPEVAALDEYYLFKDELNIFKKYGSQIAARMMGLQIRQENIFPSQNETNEANGTTINGSKEKWGDSKVGKNNFGVNGSLGKSNGLKSNLGDHSGSVGTVQPIVVELGAGPLEKTSHLLGSIHQLVTDGKLAGVKYYALDLEKRQLLDTLGDLTASFPNVISPVDDPSRIQVTGICADYFQGLSWISKGGLNGTHADQNGISNGISNGTNGVKNVQEDPPKCLLHLGSSLGNFSRSGAVEFLTQISQILRPTVDKLLICLDGCLDAEKIEHAYNDRLGKTAMWFQNGWRNAGKILKAKGGMPPAKYVNRFNEKEGRHEGYMCLRESATVEVEVSGETRTIQFEDGELVNVEYSYKWTEKEAKRLFRQSGLRLIESWKGGMDGGDYYGVYLVEKGEAFLEMNHPIPSLEEWRGLWRVWDEVTLNVIPKDMLHERPIDLRHINLFYLGHIPTFLDIQLTKSMDIRPIEPLYFRDIFERGVDPDMDDPTKIHRHSIVPKSKEDWPSLEDILNFQKAVRHRIEDIYENKLHDKPEGGLDGSIGRTLFVGFEHEAMHLETILYMIVQMAPEKINAPFSVTKPDFDSLSVQWDAAWELEDVNSTETFQPSTFAFGLDDRDSEDHLSVAKDHIYGWDNESPARKVEVRKPFKISLLTITNGQYHEFWKEGEGKIIPESWKVDGAGNVGIKTVYGLIPLELAKHWPVTGSGNMLAEYAKSKGGRLPTEFELQMLYDRHPLELDSHNVDFQNWHPVPPSSKSASSGGVWEWTSTPFDSYEGFEKSRLYPEYSTDFFVKPDQVDHWVIKGGSWGTVKRIATRRSFRNWYQMKYGMCFGGARIVWDLNE